MKIIFAVIALALCAAAAPPPPWFFEEADAGTIDFDRYIESYSDARTRGVNTPNPIYGPHNKPFGPGGALSQTDDGMNVLILLVQFTDNMAQTEAVYFDSMGYAEETFSLRNYYGEVSYGQIDIVTIDYPSETGWQTAPETYAFYVADNYGWGSYPNNTQRMVEDLCELVDPFVDFSVYDNDGDGYVDGVNVMFAGRFDGTPQTIWPHMWSLPGGGKEFDGVKVQSFSVQNEYDSTPGDKSAAVFSHEFGHILGLPDLYDYDYDSYGIGNWGMMSFGVYNGGGWSPAHFCAWSRIGLGVTEPVNVTEAGFYTVPSVEESGVVYRLWKDGAAGHQYFLVENRRPIGYDEALPGHGLLVWHIDDLVSGNDNQWYPGYTSHGHYRVALEQADGLWQLEQAQSYGDQNDPFPGTPSQNADTFSYWTVPDSKNYLFQDTGVEISSIPSSSDTVTVYFSVSQPSGLEEGEESSEMHLQVLNNPAMGEVSIQLSGGSGILPVQVFDTTGRKVAELDPGMHRVYTWNASGAPPGLYFARYGDGEDSAERRFVLLP